MPTPATDRSALDRRARATLYGSFVLVGVATVLPGPLIPELRELWSLDHAEVALLFPALFAASAVGSILSDLHLRASLLGGYGLLGLGLLGLAWGGWPALLAAMVAVGLGVGLVNPGTNLLVAYAAPPSRRSADLATLNFVWGIGATGCPLVLAALLGIVSTPVVLTLFAALVVVALAALVATLGDASVVDRAEPGAAPRADATGNAGESLELPPASLWPIALLFFFYVGTESAVSGWVVSLSEEIGGGRSISLLAHAAFWGLLLVGRGVTPIVLRRLDDRALFAVALVLSALGVGILLLVASPELVVVGSGLCGLGLAPVFPLTVSFLAERTAGGRAGGWVFAFAGLGGAALPWVSGRVAEAASGVQSSFVVPLVGVAVLAAIFASLRSGHT